MKVKLLCLNVWIGGVLFPEMVEFLQSQQADILLLQEVFNGEDETLAPQYRTYTELLKQLAMPHGVFAPAFTEIVDGKEIVQGNAVLSRFPLEEISTVYYDVPFGVRQNERSAFHLSPRNLQHVLVHLPEKNLHVLNTQGIWGEDGNDSERRLLMSQKIVDEVGSNTPLVLGGDFNIRSHTQTIYNIESRLRNLFQDELQTTFNIKRKDLAKYPGFADAVVDMLFVSEDIQVLSKSCPEVDVSDHLPLVCEMEFSQKI